MRRKFILSYSNILYCILSLTMMIDFMNGIFKGLHIGQIFRVLLITTCAISIIKYNPQKAKLFLLIILFLITNITISIIKVPAAIYTDISIGIKSILFYTIACSLIVLHQRGSFSFDMINKIIMNNLLYAPAMFILSYVFGLGNASYTFNKSALGFKSYFLSLNSVNIALLFLYIYATSKVFAERKKVKWIIACLYVAIPMLMLGTKTSLAMIIFVPLFFTFLNIKRRKTWYLIIGVAIIGVICIPILINKILPLFEAVISRQKFLFSQRDIMTYIFSTRNTRVSNILEYFFSQSSVLDLTIGRGYYDIHHYVAILENMPNDAIPLEMDWADILVTYGPIGFLYTYVFSIRILLKSRHLNMVSYGVPFFWSGVILLLYGSLAGHLFLEAISSTFYAIIIAGCFIATNEGVICSNA